MRKLNKSERQIFLALLSEIPDYRKGNAVKHKLEEIIAIGILAILCGADTFVGMRMFGLTHYKELKEYMELPKGIPCHDVFGDVFSRIDRGAVAKCFEKWIANLKGRLWEKDAHHLIAIDGKTICRSEYESHKAHHVITAYCSDLQLVLGQCCTEEKSNEITAIPELLDGLDIQGSTVTIDAMGTQKAIASKIREKGGDYILALKGNQGSMFEEIRENSLLLMAEKNKKELKAQGLFYETLDKDHGRIEKRSCWLFPDLSWYENSQEWPGLQGAALIRSERTETGKPTSCSERWFIYSHESLTAKEFLQMQRSHWAIENNLHWTLDVLFKEDDAHIRLGHAAVILNMFRKLALQMLKHDTTVQGSMTSKRLRCAWDFKYALQVVMGAKNLDGETNGSSMD